MQTFLPHKSYKKSAACLDNKRLGKQRVECLQLIRGQWKNHPASIMWRQYMYSLCVYGTYVCAEWIARGFNDTCYDKIMTEIVKFDRCEKPHWLTDEFCLSHRSNLVRKDNERYGKIWPGVPDNLPYIWPG